MNVETFTATLRERGFDVLQSEGRLFAAREEAGRSIELVASPYFAEWALYARHGTGGMVAHVRSAEQLSHILDVQFPRPSELPALLEATG